MENIKTSIVLLTYNKLDYTKLCIDSIKKYTKKGTYEIIVVDNNSSDGTRIWLKEQKDIKVILSNENLGFPGGCNIGIKVAEKDNDILLLNNDTIVTPRYLENLQNCLYSDDLIGAVGAVSNSCANYQAIKVNYESIEEMINFSEKFNISDPAKWEQKVRLIGFCMLIKGHVLEKVGLLDEVFFPGNFEDDDLGYRIQSEGYKLMLCNDTFIHHFGSTSFKENMDKFTSLLRENSIKFINKWGFNSEENSFVNFNIINKIDSKKSNINVLHIGNDTGALLYKIQYKYKNAKLYGMNDNQITSKILSNFVGVKMINIDEKILYPEEYFDYIIVTDTLEKSKAPRTALRKLIKLLRRNGKVIVTIKNSNFYEEFIKVLMGSVNFKDKRLYNYSEIKEIFSCEEFGDVKIESQTVGLSSDNEIVLDHICQLTGENMKSQYITKEYIITLSKHSDELSYVLRRIENHISVEENLKLLYEYLEDIDYDKLNEVLMKSIIKKEEVFNTIAIDLYNKQRYFDASKILELSYKYNPNHKDTVYNMSYIMYTLGDRENAIKYLDSFSSQYQDRDILRLKKEILGDTNE
ncbi:glycosyltransferase [Clostridium beijerinckii]|uniref:GT2 family glycosyltransferase n=1 Tax=Clostridium beijerinckii TaxID=1520 RepID=A0AAE5H245_CLOBE|nr:glycosyltransferase [Clostridium beijerinckii]NSB12955.1 GT2 family glycosyltransferase [Clostridium beijerinckii]OOM28254.1 glycosyl transferase family 2 [Clostridium beijerinckii]